MEYKVDDQELNAAIFISFVNKVWPGIIIWIKHKLLYPKP